MTAHDVVLDASSELQWFDLSDPVMGGVSRSTMRVANGVWVFEGVVSLENSGGFASVRSSVSRFDLSGHAGLILSVRGDGKRYGLRLRTTEAFDGVTFQADFAPDAAATVDLALPFPDFRPVFRGRVVPGHPALDPAQIRTLGLIIADRQAGAFRLEVSSIAAYDSHSA